MQNQLTHAIVVSLYGGLGNQLFQYATGRALAHRNQLPLVLDLAWFQEVKQGDASVTTHREYALTPFELNVLTQVTDQPSPLAAGLWARIQRRLERYIPQRRGELQIYREKAFNFDPDVYQFRGPVWLQGYWQSYRYFDDVGDLIRQELAQPKNPSAATQAMLQQIQQCDAICVHIRRGDYVTNKHAAATHGLCSLEYYAQGVETLRAPLQHPHCFVFSDDPQWARTHLKVSVPMTIVDINSADAAHEDLWLMSACQSFVIANSSLSWWGAWLSSHPNKRVVAPRHWFIDQSRDTRDLLPEAWIRL